MGTPVILKIVLTDGSSQRLTLSHGLPASIDDLMIEVKKQCGLQGNFRLQFMDSLFGNEFLNLTSISEVEDKGTLRVIDMPMPPTLPYNNEMGSPVLIPQAFNPLSSSVSDSSSLSAESVDTDVLSSSESMSLRSSWPAVFHVPKFSYDAELKLQQASLAYIRNGTVLIPDPKLKSAILDGLVQEIVQYKVYVSDKEMEQVAQSLIKTHPCLTEKGSCSGCGGCKTSLKYKLSNYRTRLKKLGCPEVTVNSLKNKPAGRCSAAFGVKKAKRAEVNFCPTYPTAETEESLEAMQKALLLDVKRNNREVVKLKMEKTFAHRRHEVVRDGPMVEDFMARWPALFDVTEINAEFKRITTVPLQSKFLSQLDLHSDNLMRLFQNRGGQLGKRLQRIIAQMADGMDKDAINEAIEDTIVGIFVLKEHASSDEPEDIGIVLEGIKVLQYLDTVALAVAMLFGLIYALNLSYPADLRYTFEVVQKIFMELDGSKLSNKTLALKNRLFQ
ncbi:uncharacterized protein LOC123966596 isoform X2 [Micropterus dolomieu]|uniref:uncharacterized protein LOC123966596 isoform X2 n=1 Tax=Micropterus dolomieu TaxID=147949 RepID=UPI001E8DF0A0|nr:uncharacterized protein LOC123966596 isoform X2 [Micropterus dolomieu]